MEVLVFKNEEEAAQKAFDIVKEELEHGRIKTLGLATGSTPLKLYDKMTEADLDVSDVTTVNLDEYVGLSGDNEQSYHYYMNENLFSKVKFKETNLPDGMAEDTEEECKRYEAILDRNPIDLQILGLGVNGHIGFNEPGTPFDSLTHQVELTESTREANKRFFEREEDVPTHALSMGIASILKAKQIILLAFGQAKAEAVKQMVKGTVSEDCPASALQHHPNVIVILDEPAASAL